MHSWRLARPEILSLAILLVVATAGVSTGADKLGADGKLELSVIDAATGRPLVSRVRIRDASGKDHVPGGEVVQKIKMGDYSVTGGSVEPLWTDRWFVTAGAVKLSVPAGPLVVRVEHGTEYRPVKVPVVVRKGEVTRYQVKLQRWINMRTRGYACGENHIHQPAGPLAAKLAAEGLDFGTSLSWWNSEQLEVPPGKGWQRELSFGDASIPTSVFDAELEYSSWGPVYLIGLRKHPPFQAEGTRSALSFLKDAQNQGALVCYHAGWRPEALLDSLLGYVDVINVCNNYFLRHMFLPRKNNANWMKVEGLFKYENTPLEMMRMNTDGYYRLLNCGLRLAAGAGSSSGAQDSPVGYNRAYVRAGENPDMEAFLQAWREGQNFVTNGPMIFLTAADDQDVTAHSKQYRPGDTIALKKGGGRLHLKVVAESDQPLRSLEIVANGKVVKSETLGDDSERGELDLVVDVQSGTWLTARCTAEDRLLSDEEMSQYQVGDSDQNPCRLRFGHTSPIYVTVGGQGPRVEESVDQARQMLDGFERFARDRSNRQNLPEILRALAAARKRLDPQ